MDTPVDIEVLAVPKQGKRYEEIRIRMWRDKHVQVKTGSNGVAYRLNKQGILDLTNAIIDILNATGQSDITYELTSKIKSNTTTSQSTFT